MADNVEIMHHCQECHAHWIRTHLTSPMTSLPADAECSICKETYNDGNPDDHIPVQVSHIPGCVGHVFGLECILRWIFGQQQGQVTCPLCRGVYFGVFDVQEYYEQIEPRVNAIRARDEAEASGNDNEIEPAGPSSPESNQTENVLEDSMNEEDRPEVGDSEDQPNEGATSSGQDLNNQGFGEHMIMIDAYVEAGFDLIPTEFNRSTRIVLPPLVLLLFSRLMARVGAESALSVSLEFIAHEFKNHGHIFVLSALDTDLRRLIRVFREQRDQDHQGRAALPAGNNNGDGTATSQDHNGQNQDGGLDVNTGGLDSLDADVMERRDEHFDSSQPTPHDHL